MYEDGGLMILIRKVLWHLFSQMALPQCPVFGIITRLKKFTARETYCNFCARITRWFSNCRCHISNYPLHRTRCTMTMIDWWVADLDSSDKTFDEICSYLIWSDRIWSDLKRSNLTRSRQLDESALAEVVDEGGVHKLVLKQNETFIQSKYLFRL